MPMLFCNIGWMRRYQGLTRSDGIIRGGSYIAKNKFGHEVCNFLPDKGRLFGYVQSRGRISIEKLGASPGADFVDGVTVVWTATRPEGGNVVIGWYQNARVYRSYARTPVKRSAWSKHGIEHHNILGRAEDSVLLDWDDRTLSVPTGDGGRGQSLVWYAHSAKGRAFQKKVAHLISTGRAPRAKRSRTPQDQDQKKRVEDAAMTYCRRYFEERAYVVKDVSAKNKGWDLEATAGRTTLKIEVKGRSGPQETIELTSNE